MIPVADQVLFNRLRTFFDRTAKRSSPSSRGYRDALARHYRYLIPAEASVLEVGCGGGQLLAALPNTDITGIDLSPAQIEVARTALPHGQFSVQTGEHLELQRTFDVIILSDTLNLTVDAQALLEQLHRVSQPHTRLILNYQSHLFRPIFALASALGLKQRQPTNNWLSSADIRNLYGLTDWEPITLQGGVPCPLGLLGLGRLLNGFFGPLVPALSTVFFVVARPRRPPAPEALSVSVLVPARNEAGNIEAAITRTPSMGAWTEFIFVEGHSTDHTWAEIQRVKAAYPDLRITTLQQTGKGKGNAVREGFAQAKGDVLMILDADLTMPPEELPKFYNVIAEGRAEFANGSRLVYPMESHAMRFLNMCANKGFGIMFSWLLSQPVKDTLCGTKVLRRTDYERIVANRSYFGDFDPFGDFDLLFGASKLSLKIVDVPIRYRDRTYGETNINRWRHGLLLYRMVAFAAGKMKFFR